VERISAAPAIFNSLSWRVSGLEVESEDGGGDTADCRELKEISAGRLRQRASAIDIFRAKNRPSPNPRMPIKMPLKQFSQT
jgi:hypothetical protein